MSYQALYRVWRPQRFDDMVGQQVVTRTLKNAIITHQISHAYLFAGPRGTGKTSAAKIFAKAVNCHHSKDGEPCNKCEICQAITKGQLNDVIEIDAASNNGVEEIRDIRDKAKYAPTQADYKVYIIDEVHMLSTGAFNALLKTLEEPPANVIFILATTEPHKIPLTIISRVQRFDFHRISATDSFARMKYILDEKKVQYDEKALWVIATAAEGGMRDALSILDQVLSFSDNQVKLDDALLVTGSVTKQLLKKYFLEVCQNQSAQALETMKEILEQGKDGQRFIEDLISFIRDVLLYQGSPELIKVESTGLKDEDFAELSQAASSTTLYQMIDDLNNIQVEMRFTTHPDVYLEVLTVKLSQPYADHPVATVNPATQQQPTDNSAAAEVTKLQAQVAALQQTVKQLQQEGGTVKASTPSRTVKEQPRVKQGKNRVNLHQVYPVLGAATRQDLDKIKELWGDMLNMLSVPQRSLLHVSQPVAASPDGIIVAFDYAFLFQQATDDAALIKAMEDGLQRLSGDERRVVFVPKDQWPRIRQEYIQSHGLTKGSRSSKKESPADEEQSMPASAEAPARQEAPTEKAPVAEQSPESGQQKDPVAAAQELFGSDIVKVKNNWKGMIDYDAWNEYATNGKAS